MKLIASNVELSLEEIKGYLGDNGVTAEFVDIDYHYFTNPKELMGPVTVSYTHLTLPTKA